MPEQSGSSHEACPLAVKREASRRQRLCRLRRAALVKYSVERGGPQTPVEFRRNLRARVTKQTRDTERVNGAAAKAAPASLTLL
eukprot:6191304-Pleurochrysis_carterae.AAC.1